MKIALIDPGTYPYTNRSNPESFLPMWKMFSPLLLLCLPWSVEISMILLVILFPLLELTKELYPCLKTFPPVAAISRHEKQMTDAADGCMILIPRILAL